MKEMMRRVVALLAAAAVAVVACAMGTTAYAATGTITVTPPSDTEPGTRTTYQLYKVFVAKGNGTGISYNTVNTGDVVYDDQGNPLLTSKGWTLPDCQTAYGSRTPAWDLYSTNQFLFDESGGVHWGHVKTGENGSTNTESATVYKTTQIEDVSTDTLPDYAIAAIKDYIKNDKPIKTVTATEPAEGSTEDRTVSFTDVDNGYYYVTTSTGSAVSITSANPNAAITDKNVTPTLTKTITSVSSTDDTTGTGSVSFDGKSAIAEVGSTVTYQIVVNFNAGATNVVLHDASNNDEVRLTNAAPTITYNDGQSTVDASATVRYTTGRQGEGSASAPDQGDTLTVDFSNISSSISSATVTYSAVVESGQLTSSDPAVNTAHLSYGTNNPQAVTANESTSVYNARYKVTKLDNANQPLAGAGFVLYRNPTSTSREYYKISDDGRDVSWVKVEFETSATENITYENATRAAVTSTDSGKRITELTTTDASNVLTFSGLSDGTYYLYELDAPTGYMRASDVSFTIAPATNTSQDGNGAVIAFTASNLDQEITVTNSPGSQLPGTGGFGATLLVVAGAALVAGGALLYVFKYRRIA